MSDSFGIRVITSPQRPKIERLFRDDRRPANSAMAGQPELSIIIINWNSKAFLQKCLTSIFSEPGNSGYEIVVLDNASRDGCADMIESEFPAVRFIQGDENVGFARANNLGARHSRGRHLLFLNPDTEVVGTAIKKMLDFLKSHEDAGIVGARLLNSDLSLQTSCIQAFPSILNQVLDAECFRCVTPRSRLWGMRPLFDNTGQPVSVDAISGACLMLRRDVFESAGMFNEDYFMYAEDVDLCYRVRRSGRRNYYVPDAVVVHHGGQSTSSSQDKNFAAVMLRESRLRYFRAHRGRSYASVYRGVMAIAAVCRLFFLGFRLLATFGRGRSRPHTRALAKWLKILRWSIGFERWVKNPIPNAASRHVGN